MGYRLDTVGAHRPQLLHRADAEQVPLTDESDPAADQLDLGPELGVERAGRDFRLYLRFRRAVDAWTGGRLMADGVEGQLEPAAVGGIAAGFDEGTVTAAATHNWRRRALVAAAISLLASGAIVAASFMPWLGSETGRTLSGWDIYEVQRDAGHNVFWISRFFTDPDGRSVGFFTGRATLLSGLGLAGVTVVFLILNIMLRQRQLRRGPQAPGRSAMSVRLVGVLQLLVAIGAIAAPMVTAGFYFEGGQASGASLEYGLILLWAAAYVGFLGNVFGCMTVWDRENLRGRDYLTYLMGAVFVAVGVAAGNFLAMI